MNKLIGTGKIIELTDNYLLFELDLLKEINIENISLKKGKTILKNDFICNLNKNQLFNLIGKEFKILDILLGEKDLISGDIEELYEINNEIGLYCISEVSTEINFNIEIDGKKELLYIGDEGVLLFYRYNGLSSNEIDLSKYCFNFLSSIDFDGKSSYDIELEKKEKIFGKGYFTKFKIKKYNFFEKNQNYIYKNKLGYYYHIRDDEPNFINKEKFVKRRKIDFDGHRLYNELGEYEDIYFDIY